jgi:hypothetical protein
LQTTLVLNSGTPVPEALKGIRSSPGYNVSKNIRYLKCGVYYELDHGCVTVIRVVAKGTALLVAWEPTLIPSLFEQSNTSVKGFLYYASKREHTLRHHCKYVDPNVILETYNSNETQGNCISIEVIFNHKAPVQSESPCSSNAQAPLRLGVPVPLMTGLHSKYISLVF